ncbi:RICIN domain-containing protein [Catenuloplanes japonicus]|uniref:RICIN domain-containing protein n=1 Tax=Catenuloplanes japonicus TaxID=33876 RepID=UPI000AFC50D2|nr:RICIN domain-containing protein [Catenuloplanes japonicus]
MRINTLTRMATSTAALCLAVAGSFAAAGAASASAPVAYQQIRNAVHNQCVDAPGGALNVRVKLSDCSSGEPTRHWALVPTGAASTYFIVNQGSGYCLEVNNGTATPGEAVDQFTCNGSSSEKWIREGLRLRHSGTNQCLDTAGGRDSALIQYTCGAEAPAGIQSWIIE